MVSFLITLQPLLVKHCPQLQRTNIMKWSNHIIRLEFFEGIKDLVSFPQETLLPGLYV